jgi:tetratricopeptide (TPR) repeat protein
MLNWLKFVFENPSSWPIVIVLGACWILRSYGRFLWKKDKRGLRQFWLPLLAVGLSIFLVAGPLARYVYLYRGLPAAFGASEIGILVAEVPGDKESEWQSKYARAIREQVDKSPQLRELIKVRLLERQLSSDPEEQQEEALAIGRRLHAVLVLRPLPVEGVQEPWLTVVDQPHFSKEEALIGKKFPNADLARLEELPLPSDVILLSRCVLALSLYRRKSYTEAREQLKEVLTANQLPPIAPERSDLEVLYGDTFLATHRMREAEAEYHKALILKPMNADAHNMLGIALGQQDQVDAAIAEFQEAIFLKPNLIYAYMNIGAVLDHMRQYDAAIIQYRKAIALKAEMDDILYARYGLSAALVHKGQYDDAIAEIRKILAVRSKDAGMYYDLGNIYFNKGADREIKEGAASRELADRDFDAAINEYKKALLLKPEPVLAAMIHINKAGVLETKGLMDDAITELRTALVLDSGIDDSGIKVAHGNLGSIFAAIGRNEDAINEFQKALAITPKDPSLCHALGKVLSAKGKYADAVVQYRKALELNPADVGIQKDLAVALQRNTPSPPR